MAKKPSKLKKYFKSYNIVPLIIILSLILIAIRAVIIAESWDYKFLFIVAFFALAYPIISNIEDKELKYSDKIVEHISAQSTEELNIELNKALINCKRNKCRNVDVHVIDSNNAILIITE